MSNCPGPVCLHYQTSDLVIIYDRSPAAAGTYLGMYFAGKKKLAAVYIFPLLNTRIDHFLKDVEDGIYNEVPDRSHARTF